MWRRSSTRTLVSPFGTLAVRIRFALCGDITFKILRVRINEWEEYKCSNVPLSLSLKVLFSSLIVTTEIVSMRLVMN